eukprot:symbB.v1.2.017858.t1/scaffold1397.1/size143028/5
MKLPYVLSRVGQEFVIGPETWEEESDEEEDFPFKDWVGHLGERTLRGPFSSKKQQEVSQWLLEKDEEQKRKWKEIKDAKQKPFSPVVPLPPQPPPAEVAAPRLLGSPRRLRPVAQRPRQRHSLREAPKLGGWMSASLNFSAVEKKSVIPECEATEVTATPRRQDDSCPAGWGRLKDYVNGVRIGPGSLFSHPWDGPAPSGLHPLAPRRRSHDLTSAVM